MKKFFVCNLIWPLNIHDVSETALLENVQLLDALYYLHKLWWTNRRSFVLMVKLLVGNTGCS